VLRQSVSLRRFCAHFGDNNAYFGTSGIFVNSDENPASKNTNTLFFIYLKLGKKVSTIIFHILVDKMLELNDFETKTEY